MSQNAKKKRLSEAMKKNIARRKGQDDIDLIKNKISNFKVKKEPIKKIQKADYWQIFGYIIDLFSGGLAGFIIGYVSSKIFHIESNVLAILCLIFGIMGGFYNIIKRNKIFPAKK